jgi:hypothetical protein
MTDVPRWAASVYDEIVRWSAGDSIMSSGIKVPRSARPRLARTKLNINKVGEARQPDTEKIDTSSLQIDETFDVDGDPYNSTGQFLADARKRKYSD